MSIAELHRFAAQATAKGHTRAEVRGAIAAALVIFRDYSRSQAHDFVRSAI